MTSQDPQLPQGTRRRRRAIITAAAITLVSMIVIVMAAISIGGGSDSGQRAVPLPFAGPTSTQSPATPNITPTPATSPSHTTLRPFRYQPLWPFASEKAAAAWQHRYRVGGQQPWHLDAEQTALSFTTGYLGFTEIDKVVSRAIRGDDARITVGYQNSDGSNSVAAVLHLVRIGGGLDAPWEVVGTNDTMLTLDKPEYGATVASPLNVSGRITGVDDSIRIDVRQLSSAVPIGTYCCVTAGGDLTPWSARVNFRGATDQVALTIVASTGGHVQGVERFTISGIRPVTG
jgi:hypothetical protein